MILELNELSVKTLIEQHEKTIEDLNNELEETNNHASTVFDSLEKSTYNESELISKNKELEEMNQQLIVKNTNLKTELDHMRKSWQAAEGAVIAREKDLIKYESKILEDEKKYKIKIEELKSSEQQLEELKNKFRELKEVHKELEAKYVVINTIEELKHQEQKEKKPAAPKRGRPKKYG